MSDVSRSPTEGADLLTVQYAKQASESIVYSGILVAGALVIFGMPRAPILAFLAALFSLGVALYHWPFVARDRRALVVSPAGLRLDRLGLLPWNAISDVEIVDHYLRSLRNAELRITLRRPLNTAVEDAPAVGLFRRYMYRCWKATGPQQISVGLSTLDRKPEAIEAAVRQHIHRPV